MREWRLQSPVKVIEKVKAMLLAERTGAEWEILEGNEWEEEEGQADAPAQHVAKFGRIPRIEETGVLVPAHAEIGVQHVQHPGTGSRMPRIEETGVLVPGQDLQMGMGNVEQGARGEGEESEEKGKGKSGWMKLKSR